MAASGPPEMGSDHVSLEGLKRWRDGVLESGEVGTWTAHWMDDATLRRYIVAEKGNEESAKNRIIATAKWRSEHVVDGARCPECPGRPTSHCIVGLGLGARGRPVVYSSPPRAESTAAAAAVTHITCTMERGFALEGSSGQWVWLVDMRGYTLWSSMANTGSGAEMARVFSAHYPERLGAVVLLDPPSVFQVLLAAIRPFLDARTVDKIRSVHGPEAVAAELSDLLTPEQRAWVDEAMALDPTPGNLPPASLMPPGAPPGADQPLTAEALRIGRKASADA